MTESDRSRSSPGMADWLFKGVLAKLGDKFDSFTGRKLAPSGSLATSGIIERIKMLLDSEAIEVPGKGKVVPNNIRLKMQWDKFASDDDKSIDRLQAVLLAAAVDHINDSLYYTYAPVSLVISDDYFVEGIKLIAGFDGTNDDGREVTMDLAPSHDDHPLAEDETQAKLPRMRELSVRYRLAGREVAAKIEVQDDGRVSVGRGSGNKLSINDPGVSTMHATILIGEQGEISVADIGSTNGTFINDKRIAYGKVHALSPTDRLRFGTVEVSLEVVITQPQAEPIPEAVTDGNSVEINGFEFREKSSAQPTAANTGAESVSNTATTIAFEADHDAPETDDSGKLPGGSE